MSKKEKPAAQSVIHVPITKILPDPDNHRNTINEDADRELAASIKLKGIVQPITVRPCTTDKRFDYFVVCGHRRLRAAKIAKLDTVPAIVRNIDANEVLEIQLIENLQREEVTPLDEAKAFETLMAKETLDVLAAKINKSKKYISDRLNLLKLNVVAQTLLAKGKLPIGHALLVSKLQPDDQRTVLDKCFGIIDFEHPEENTDDEYEVAMCENTLDELRTDIEDLFANFNRANFDPADETLYAEAGACNACQFRTTNSQLLFADITSLDKCTNVGCFKKKTSLFLKRAELELKQEVGEKLVKGEIKLYGGSNITVKGQQVGYSDLPGKGLTPVLINKTDSWKPQALGKVVYVDMKKVDKAAEEKKATSAGKAVDRTQHEAEEFNTTHLPRIKKYIEHLQSEPGAREPVLLEVIVAERLRSADISLLMLCAIYLGVDDNLVKAEDVYMFEKDLRRTGWDKMSEYRVHLIGRLRDKCSPIMLAHILLLNEILDTWDDFASDHAVDLEADDHEITLEKVFGLSNFKP